MPRPPEKRRVQSPPPCAFFKPAGIRAVALEEVRLTVDEYEVLRLIDYEGAYQEQAAQAMGVSRQTVGRIAESARRKVADALVNAKALRIEGGAYFTGGGRGFACKACKHRWDSPLGSACADVCPECGGQDVRRTDESMARKGRPGCRGKRTGRGHGHNKPDDPTERE